MSIFIETAGILNDYGVELKVWPYDELNTQPYEGAPMGEQDLSSLHYDKRLEPVFPVNTSNSILGSLISGGEEIEGDLIWLSTGLYKVGSLVQVATQGDITYKIHSSSSYKGYSDLIIYELKGDNIHDSGY